MQTKLELYQRVASLAELGIWERDFVSGQFYWNKIIRVILEVEDDYSPTIEESLRFYKKPESVTELLDKAIQSGIPERADLELVTAKSNHKWVRLRLQAESINDRCSRIYGTLEDITESVRLSRMLEERERRFSMAFDHAPIGMALVSISGAWLKVNHSLCKLLGYTEQEFLQHTFQDFTHRDDLDKDVSQMRSLLDGTIGSYSAEKRYLHANGDCIWALLSTSVIRDEADQPLYFISQMKDITERRKNLQIIHNQNSRLLNFAHIVSHNLRSHTSNITMIADMAASEPDEEERNTLLQMLTTNSNNLLQTLGHLNEIVKIQDDGQLECHDLYLAREVKRVMDILSASLQQNNATVSLNIEEHIRISFNPSYLESIIINLVSNSVKYKHPDHLLAIDITAEKKEGSVIMRVADNGLGIDLLRHGHKLFGMYKTFHRHVDARGIGLFITKSQIESMGGNIYAESKPGEGATFIVEFN